MAGSTIYFQRRRIGRELSYFFRLSSWTLEDSRGSEGVRAFSEYWGVGIGPNFVYW